MVSMEEDEDIRGGTIEELPVGLAVVGDGLCAQRVVETPRRKGVKTTKKTTSQKKLGERGGRMCNR